jgi:hypothetical protein
MLHYAETCFLVSIVLFVLDGLGIARGAHLLSWGSAAFAAGFLTFALFLGPRDRRRAVASSRQGNPSPRESAGELGEDGQVGVEANALDASDAERE